MVAPDLAGEVTVRKPVVQVEVAIVWTCAVSNPMAIVVHVRRVGVSMTVWESQAAVRPAMNCAWAARRNESTADSPAAAHVPTARVTATAALRGRGQPIHQQHHHEKACVLFHVSSRSTSSLNTSKAIRRPRSGGLCVYAIDASFHLVRRQCRFASHGRVVHRDTTVRIAAHGLAGRICNPLFGLIA